MSENIEKVLKAIQIAEDPSLPDWQQANHACKAMSGLILSDLEPSAREQVDLRLIEINQIIASYKFETEEDYQRLSDSDASRLKDLALEVARHSLHLEVERVLRQLSEREKFPKSAILTIRAHRDLFIPKLLQIIRQAVDGVSRGEKAEDFDPLMAFCLLAEFEERQLHPLLMEILRLPGEAPMDLLGGAVHELLPGILAYYCVGDLNIVEELAIDLQVNKWVRGAAMSAFKYLVRDDVVSSNTAVPYLERVFEFYVTRSAADDATKTDSMLLAFAICELGNLAATKTLPAIRDAFERDLVDQMVVDLPFVEDQMANAEQTLEETFSHCRLTGLPDVVKELSWWACFGDSPQNQRLSTRKSQPERMIQRVQSEFPKKPNVTPVSTIRSGPKVGRNDPCPCGSGKKYKKCCL
jgi:hypothetical protein